MEVSFNLYGLSVYEPQQNLGRGLSTCKTRVSPLTDRSKAVLWFILSHCSSAFCYSSACVILLYAVLIVCVSFPVGCMGMIWNSIVSVPDNCLFIYFKYFMFRRKGPTLTGIKKNR